jgi:nucleolar MIF4G domain-containing protein 1
MSRRPTQRNGLKLPRQLQQELGLGSDAKSGVRGRHGSGGVGGRKEKRQAERAEKRAGRQSRNTRHVKGSARGRVEQSEDSDEDQGSQNEEERAPAVKAAPRNKVDNLRAQAVGQERQRKSILKKAKAHPVDSPFSSEDCDQPRSLSPGLVLDKSSRSFRDRAAQDDADVAALEKKLGLRSKKLPKSFDEDGLDDLLEGIESADEMKKRKREGQDWLESKRKKTEADYSSDEGSEDLESDGQEVDDLQLGGSLDESSEMASSEDENFDGFISGDGVPEAEPEDEPEAGARKRENPYVAPISESARTTAKYVPPSLRKSANSDSEDLQRLRRQLQGHLNKLSEANLTSILAGAEELYQSNARQDVTSTLIDLLLSLFCDPAVLQNTFIILHASFVTAVYKVIGTDFGADFVSQLVHRFESFHEQQESASCKQAVNLISLLAHLYTFHMIGSNLVFDHIRLLLETLNEANAELLLRVVRDAGPQLRQDDPSSLKNIVMLMQKAATKAQTEGKSISVRTKFMIETITDLKNNKLKAELASSGVASEHITRMRKVLGTLNTRTIRASEPLRIGLADVKNADKGGKWWLIGASWKGEEMTYDSVLAKDGRTEEREDFSDSGEVDLLALARQHRMNTAIRRAIFMAIMSATDYENAHLRLLKLRLKRSQEQEIPRVLMHCAGEEEKYNPYYTLIVKTLCADKKLRMGFQFSLWSFFKRMGERGEDTESDEEDGSERVQLKEIVNVAKMFASLIGDGTMSLGVLKTLDLACLKDQAKMFVEVLLIVVITKSQEGVDGGRKEERLAPIFVRCKDTPQVAGPLRHFLKKVVRHTDLAGTKAEARLIRWGCDVGIDALKLISSNGSGSNI